jgi:hypothetical protein
VNAGGLPLTKPNGNTRISLALHAIFAGGLQ